MVVFDAAHLLLLINPATGKPLDFEGKPVERVEERIAHLIGHLERAKIKIIVPTPALAELLVNAGKPGPEIIEMFNKSAVFRIVPFDTLAAIEVAAVTRAAKAAGDKRGGLAGTWAKVKYDRQIVAIAKVAQATMIYSDDDDIRRLAENANIPVTRVAELPLPPDKKGAEHPESSPQRDLFAANSEEATDDAALDFPKEESGGEEEPEPEPA